VVTAARRAHPSAVQGDAREALWVCFAAPFKTILVPADFSSSSTLALEYAHTLARQFRAALVVVHRRGSRVGGTSGATRAMGRRRAPDGAVQRVQPSGFMNVSALGVEEQRVNVILDFVDSAVAAVALDDNYRAEVRIVVWRGEDVVQVPTGALFRREIPRVAVMARFPSAAGRPQSPWVVIVEPGAEAKLLVVVAVCEMCQWRARVKSPTGNGSAPPHQFLRYPTSAPRLALLPLGRKTSEAVFGRRGSRCASARRGPNPPLVRTSGLKPAFPHDHALNTAAHRPGAKALP
jgi:hypothetical protein